MADGTCSIDGCGNPVHGHRWCMKHYKRWYAHGDPAILLRSPNGSQTGTCSLSDCDRPARKRGWCAIHYQQWRRTGDPLPKVRPAVCLIEGCTGSVKGRGWCNTHYLRWRRHGDPLFEVSTEQRFWAKVNQDGPVPPHRPDLGPCWTWTAGLDENTSAGYGRFHVDGKPVGAHCFAYELLVRPVPAGLHLDHLCRNPPCVNPAHLEPVTCRVNLMRGETPAAVNAAKTCCIRKHEFTEANTYVAPDGSRNCRTCARERSRRRYWAAKAAA
jgi:hypothetical protein